MTMGSHAAKKQKMHKGLGKKKKTRFAFIYYTRKPVFLCDVECVCTQSIGWD